MADRPPADLATPAASERHTAASVAQPAPGAAIPAAAAGEPRGVKHGSQSASPAAPLAYRNHELVPVERDARGRFLPGKGRRVPGRGVGRGNLNGTRYPWRVFLRRGGGRHALRQQDRWTLAIVEAHAASLLSDKPHPSEAEARMIELASVGRGCTALLLDALREAGGVGTDKGLALVRELRAFLALEARALSSLGLQRRAHPVDPVLAARELVEREHAEAERSRAAAAPEPFDVEALPAPEDDAA